MLCYERKENDNKTLPRLPHVCTPWELDGEMKNTIPDPKARSI